MARGVSVSTILPGRVDTPMLGDLQVPRVSAKIPPEKVARAIVRAAAKRRPEVYVPLVGSKALVLVSTLSPRLGDMLVRRLRLEGSPPERSYNDANTGLDGSPW